MSGPLDFLDLMRQTATIAPYAGVDRYDKRQYGAPVTYRCRLSGKQRQVLDARGEMVVSMQTLYLASGDAIDPLSLVTLSTADVGSTAAQQIQPAIIATGRFPDENGSYYTEIFL